jgi:hypothetical protein
VNSKLKLCRYGAVVMWIRLSVTLSLYLLLMIQACPPAGSRRYLRPLRIFLDAVSLDSGKPFHRSLCTSTTVTSGQSCQFRQWHVHWQLGTPGAAREWLQPVLPGLGVWPRRQLHRHSARSAKSCGRAQLRWACPTQVFSFYPTAQASGNFIDTYYLS